MITKHNRLAFDHGLTDALRMGDVAHITQVHIQKSRNYIIEFVKMALSLGFIARHVNDNAEILDIAFNMGGLYQRIGIKKAGRLSNQNNYHPVSRADKCN